MKKIGCRDLGSSCRFEAKAKSLEQLVPLMEDHARFKHDLKFLSLEIEDLIRERAQSVGESQKEKE